mmetsp:Transcript_15565/g.48919  ORF Transcript_15565/g.48919 Transcript_15565/m.48919 type:complete len:81 (+) Transcript_15565:92-334(+)
MSCAMDPTTPAVDVDPAYRALAPPSCVSPARARGVKRMCYYMPIDSGQSPPSPHALLDVLLQDADAAVLLQQLLLQLRPP